MESGNELFLAGLAISSLVLLVLLIRKSFSAKSDLGGGIVSYFTSQNTLFIFVLTALVMIAEAGLAASFHPEGARNNVPLGARFLAHFAFSFTGWLMLIKAGSSLGETILYGMTIKTAIPAKIAGKEKERRTAIAKFIVGFLFKTLKFSFNVVLGIGFPIANLYITALGLEQDLQMKFFLQDMTRDMAQFYTQVPIEAFNNTTISASENGGYLPSNYNPFKDMAYPLQLMLFIVSMQVVLGFYKSIDVAIATIVGVLNPATMAAPAASPAASGGGSSTTEDEKKIEESIKFILFECFNLDNPGDLNSKVKTAMGVYVRNIAPDTSKKMALVAALARLKSGIEDLIRNDHRSNNTQEWKTFVQNELIPFLNGSATSGYLGLNMSAQRIRTKEPAWIEGKDGIINKHYGDMKDVAAKIKGRQFRIDKKKKKGDKRSSADKRSCINEASLNYGRPISNINGCAAADCCMRSATTGRCEDCNYNFVTIPQVVCDECQAYASRNSFDYSDVDECIVCAERLPVNPDGICAGCIIKVGPEYPTQGLSHAVFTNTCMGCGERFYRDKSSNVYCSLCTTKLAAGICLNCEKDAEEGIVDEFGYCNNCGAEARK